MKVLDIGGGDGVRASELYPAFDVKVFDLKNGNDVMFDPLPKGYWNVILLNHVIEHVINPDLLLEKCRDLMDENTILDIGTPNLCAWFNRALFLAGYVPHSMELSTRFNVGKPFDWGMEPLGGHIRVFTVDALIELLKCHGFRILSLEGEYSNFPCNFLIRFIDRTFTKISPRLASMFRVKCKKL